MSEETDKSKIIERIRKILAIAKDARGNEHEARVAMRQAFALMTKHSISEAECAAAMDSGRIIEKCVDIEGLCPHVANAIFRILQNHFGVNILTRRIYRKRGYKTAVIVGDEQRIDFAEYVLGFLRVVMVDCYAKKREEFKANFKILDKFSYYSGFSSGVCDILQEAEEAEVKQATDTQKASFALVVQNNKEAIQSFMSANYADIKEDGYSPKNLEGGAYRSGVDDGRKTQINKPIEAE